MMLSVLLALLVQVSAQPASIAGTAVNSGTGEPVANLRVALVRVDAASGAFAQLVSGRTGGVEESLPGDALRMLIRQIEVELSTGNLPPEAQARAAAFKSLPIDDIQEI